jgi:PKD repeat protein
VRLYEKQWDTSVGRTFSVGYDVGNDGSVEYTSPTIDQNHPESTPALSALGIGQQSAWVQSYVYETGPAQTSIALKINNSTSATYHFYGISNQRLTTSVGGNILPTGTTLRVVSPGLVNLAGGTNTVSYLYIDGSLMATGTWGSATSGAAHTNSHFTGSGMLVVTTSAAANFSATPTNGYAPLKVVFTDTSVGTITNRYWDFGDGQTTNTTATSVTNKYAGVGPYTVTLIVYGDAGAATNTQPNYINVSTVPAIPPLGSGQFGFNPTTGTATFHIASSNGLQYCIQYNADLLNTNGWTLLDPPGWTNGTTGVTIILQDTTAAGATQRFYKVEAKAVDAQ